MNHDAVQRLLQDMQVSVRHKSSSPLMRFLTVLLRWFGLDFERFWTTIGTRTIYAPSHVNLTCLGCYETVIQHELVHIRQARRFPVLFQLSYLLAPLPFGLAWCRWRWEREAYLVDLRAGRFSVDEAVNTLWSHYGWCWPKSWMRRWFEQALRDAEP